MGQPTPRQKELSPSTMAKHLRVLRSLLDAARSAGYTGRNPVDDLPKQHRLRAHKRESAYFTNDEIPVLREHLSVGVYSVLIDAALKTGCRLGELLGLLWGDVELHGQIAHIRRTRTQGHVHAPKTHEKREVVLVDDLIDVLGRWYGELGRPDDDVLVFPGTARDGYLDPTTVTSRVLYRAMRQAGIPRVGPTGEKRTFHSLRHTFAKRALESGASITWLSRQYGALVDHGDR
jgi:integrase